MSDQEREIRPPEAAPESWSLEDAPKLEETLSERLSETAEAVTAELKDLQESLEPSEDALRIEPVAPEALPVISEPLPVAPEDVPGAAPRPAAAAAPESTSDDRLLSALAWVSMVILQLPIVSIIQLLSPTNKERVFQKHHAVTSLLFYAASIVYEVVALVVYLILGLVTLGFGFACLWVLFFVPHLFGLYFALQAYNGKQIELPILSDFGRKQGWL